MQGALRAGHGTLGASSSPDLRCYYVWLPVLAQDSAEAAAHAAATTSDWRAAHYWDSALRFAREMGIHLGIGKATGQGTETAGVAWDVYALYGRGMTDLGRPNLWMHQLDIVDAPRLEVPVLRAEVAKLLQR